MISLPKASSVAGCFLGLLAWTVMDAPVIVESHSSWDEIRFSHLSYADKRPNLPEIKKEIESIQKGESEMNFATYKEMRKMGYDEVSNSKQSIVMRNFLIKRGILRNQPKATVSDLFFPGQQPEAYLPGDTPMVYSDSMTSKTTFLPLNFYYFPMCPPHADDGVSVLAEKKRRNIGSVLQGLDSSPTPFDLKVLEDKPCTPICVVNFTPRQVHRLRKVIGYYYRIHLSLDGLPVLMRSSELNYAVRGYPVGFKAPPSFTGIPHDEFFLYNHVKFTITYRQYQEDPNRILITGFDVHPVSITHDVEDPAKTCHGYGVHNSIETYLSLPYLPLNSDGIKVVYSYDVEWVENDDLLWANRWDVYVVGRSDFGVRLGVIAMVLTMAGIALVVVIRALRKDIARYRKSEGSQEESGWMVIHGDVFRPPEFSPMLLSVAIGTGSQIVVSFGLTVLLAMLHVINQMHKGQFLTSLITLYPFCGLVAGYVSTHVYKLCGKSDLERNTFYTAIALPMGFGIMFLVLNFFLIINSVSNGVNMNTGLILLLIYPTANGFMVYLGARIGRNTSEIKIPTKINENARAIPKPPLHTNFFFRLLFSALWFAPMSAEFSIAMSHIWLGPLYYDMGFLLLATLFALLISTQIGVLLCYVQLRAEDHRWWWKSFTNSGMAGIFAFLLSLSFLTSRLDLVGVIPHMVYLIYMSMISICVGLACGSIGFLSSLWFVRSIYGAIEISDDSDYLLCDDDVSD